MTAERDFVRILILSGSSGAEALASYVSGYQYDVEKNVSLARRRLNENDYGLIIINSPLIDEQGDEFAYELAERTSSGIVFITKNEGNSELSYKMNDEGIFCIYKPFVKTVLENAICFALATNRRLMRSEKKNDTLKNKMEEIRLVGRAKLLLVEKLKMTESDAHRYIEKRAMDACERKTDVALEIIKTYEN